MGEGAFLMVHQPWGFAVGDKEDMLKTAEILEKVEGEIVGIYARRSGQDVETAREWVRNETWFTGGEAVEAGLADAAVADAERRRSWPGVCQHGAIFQFRALARP